MSTPTEAPEVRVFHRPTGWVLPDYTDLADCTTNYHRQQDGRPPCTATAVWKVVEDHGMHLTIGFYCDTDLPAEHRPPRTNTPDRHNPDGSTTIKMKRACNGCGQHLGDVTEQEMARGINGLPLPDVRKECPTCGPTAPEPRCLPVSTVDGDEACLDGDCDHSIEPGADHCTNTSTHTVCLTHSTIHSGGTITHAEPWPCQKTPKSPAAA